MTFELPDPAAIAAQLAQAQQARSQLDRVIAWLEDGVELFSGAAPVPGLPAAADPPEKPKRQRSAPKAQPGRHLPPRRNAGARRMTASALSKTQPRTTEGEEHARRTV